MSDDDLLTSLKVIAQVGAGERLSTRGSSIEVDSRSGLAQAAARWWGGESRRSNLDALARIVNAAIQSAAEDREEGEGGGTSANRLRAELRRAAEGLRNLRQTTYKGCSVSAARLDVLLENIENAAAIDHEGGGGA